MSSTSSTVSVLVILSTGKLGSGVVDAFLLANGNNNTSKKKYKIYGTSRNPEQHAKSSSNKKADGVTLLPFQYGDKASIEAALATSQADVVVVITHSHSAKTWQKEVEYGKIIIDACCQRGENNKTPHVILASCDLADLATDEKAHHLYSKKKLEDYLKGLAFKSATSCSILRPSSFMENFHDPSVYNPLCRGSLKDLYPGNHIRVNHVSVLDVGKAAVVMAKDPKQWSGKTLVCIASRDTGDELATVLSKVSKIPCTYQATPPWFILKYILTPLYHMVELCKSLSADSTANNDWSQEIKAFRTVVPDAMDFKTWLETRQQTWSDGTRFGAPAPDSVRHGKSWLLGVGGLVAAIAVGIVRYVPLVAPVPSS